jgi:hypothetical protein
VGRGASQLFWAGPLHNTKKTCHKREFGRMILLNGGVGRETGTVQKSGKTQTVYLADKGRQG